MSIGLRYPGRNRRRRRTLYKGRRVRRRMETLPSLILLQSLDNRKPKPRRPLVRTLFLVLLCLGLWLLWTLVRDPTEPGSPGPRGPDGSPVPGENRVSGWPERLAGILDELPGATCVALPDGTNPGGTLYTTLDPSYQRWVTRRLRRSMALGGVVTVLEPHSGRILALSSYNKDPEHPEAFFWKAYPAASLFKVVTAAAVLELGILKPNSVLAYTGGNYTLYARDLKDRVYPWSTKATLRKAFALSVNSIFGKIGIHSLGRERLMEYGAAFYFTQPLPTQVPVETSRLDVPEDPIGIAEIASGFNRRTVLTSLHAAWIAAVIAADGAAPAPWLIARSSTEGYQERPPKEDPIPIRVISPATARKMHELMEGTIRYGTCVKTFASRRRDRRLRSVRFGGKTGSINDTGDRIRYDWFLGYGIDRQSGRQIALSVLIIHGRLLGHHANVVAFDLLRHFFHCQGKASSSAG